MEIFTIVALFVIVLIPVTAFIYIKRGREENIRYIIGILVGLAITIITFFITFYIYLYIGFSDTGEIYEYFFGAAFFGILIALIVGGASFCVVIWLLGRRKIGIGTYILTAILYLIFLVVFLVFLSKL